MRARPSSACPAHHPPPRPLRSAGAARRSKAFVCVAVDKAGATGARVGCATDDDFVPFACSTDFAIKTLEELSIVSWPFYELTFVTLLLFAVDKHLATR
ncbi:hypothetical protein K1T71_002439 [Dendrolimus kikuchii]|uniref:Uncharacterized protein n=1 Tax=Dendrolimus kikuchii TaxID=765133 RepID=A0ACC1DE64_9NEOP|nr:hypothetical protein K1T71_002439 [Dendrolimus kikuchii]